MWDVPASCHLQPLFMSADSGGVSGPPDSEQSPQPSEAKTDASSIEQESVLKEGEDWSEGMGRDCVVCQNAAVNRVLLPCRHACVCDSCVSHFQHCPICRAFVLESFALTQGCHTEPLNVMWVQLNCSYFFQLLEPRWSYCTSNQEIQTLNLSSLYGKQ